MKNSRLSVRLRLLRTLLSSLLLAFAGTGNTYAQTTYYSQASASDFNNTSGWGTNTDGSGSNPSSISQFDHFVVANGASLTFSSASSVYNLTVQNGSLIINQNLNIHGNFYVNGGSVTLSGSSVTNINLYGSFETTGGTVAEGTAASTLVFYGSAAANIVTTGASVSFGNIQIGDMAGSNKEVTLLNNISIPAARTLMVYGQLNTNNVTVSGAGNFTLDENGTLGVKDSYASVSGTVIALSGTKTFTNGIIEYNASGNQTIDVAAHPASAMIQTAGSGVKTLSGNLTLSLNSRNGLNKGAIYVQTGTTFSDGGYAIEFTGGPYADVIIWGTYQSTGSGKLKWNAGMQGSSIYYTDNTQLGDIELSFNSSLHEIYVGTSGTASLYIRNFTTSGTGGGLLTLSTAGSCKVYISGNVNINPSTTSNTGGGFGGTLNRSSEVHCQGNISTTSTAATQPVFNSKGTNQLIIDGSGTQIFTTGANATILASATLKINCNALQIGNGSNRTLTMGANSTVSWLGGSVSKVGGSDALSYFSTGTTLQLTDVTPNLFVWPTGSTSPKNVVINCSSLANMVSLESDRSLPSVSFTVSSGATFNMGNNKLTGTTSTFTVTGTLQTSNLNGLTGTNGSFPSQIPTFTSAGIAEYNAATDSQTVSAIQYTNLTFSGNAIKKYTGTVSVSGTFEVNGGTVACHGTFAYNGTSAQDVKGISYKNLSLSNSNKTLVADASIAACGTLTLGAGVTFDADGPANDKVLTFKSNATGAANVAELPSNSSITGTVVVERFVPAITTGPMTDRRRYRFFTSTVATNANGSYDLSVFTNIIDVTGPGGAANGFTTTGTNAPSSFLYDESYTISSDLNEAWYSPASTTDQIAIGKGIRVLIRGSKGQGLNYNSADTNTFYTPDDVTLKMTGTLNQGTITLPITYTSNDNSDEDGWCLVGNPFVTAIDWNLVKGQGSSDFNNVDDAMYVWNPKGTNSSKGGYASFVNGIGTGTPEPGSNIVSGGQSFFVKASAANPVIKVKESHKVIGNNVGFYGKSTNDTKVRVKLLLGGNAVDDAVVYFEEGATDGYDTRKDAVKMTTGIGVSSNPKNLCIAAFEPLGKGKEIQLSLDKINNGSYELSFHEFEAFAGNYHIYIKDKMLNKQTEITESLKYGFEVVNTNAESYGNRFSLVFAAVGVDVNEVVKAGKDFVSLYPVPAKDIINISLFEAKNAILSVVDLAGKEVLQQILTEQNQVNVAGLERGVYLARVSNGGQLRTIKFVLQ